MAKWNVAVILTGYVDVEIEADNYSKAIEKATLIANSDMVHSWYRDIDYCERKDD